MAEEGTPEILAEQRLGHQVPGMRGLYTHVSERMRAELTQALQARWEESLKERAALNKRSPVPLLNELLAQAAENKETAHPTTDVPTPPGTEEQGEDDLPFPPNPPRTPFKATKMKGTRGASDLVRAEIR